MAGKKGIEAGSTPSQCDPMCNGGEFSGGDTLAATIMNAENCMMR